MRILIVLLFSLSVLHAEKWAILPVETNGIDRIISPLPLTGHPATDGKEISRAMMLYLRAGGMNQLASPAAIERAMREQGLPVSFRQSPASLHAFSLSADADRVLVSRIQKTQDGFLMESRVYFRESNSLTDPIETRHGKAAKLIGIHLRERFPSLKSPFFSILDSSRPAIFIVDASGNMHKEKEILASFIEKENFPQIAICAIHADKTISRFSLKGNRGNAVSFIRNLKISGGSADGIPLSAGLLCAEEENPFSGSEIDKPDVFILTGNSIHPEDLSATKNRMRQLSARAHRVVFWTGILTPESRNQYQSLSAEADRISDSSILPIRYSVTAGLSDGSQWSGFFAGGFLERNGTRTELSSRDENSLLVRREPKFLEEYTGLKVVDPVSVAVQLEAVDKFSKQYSGKTARVLLRINGVDAWVSIPYSRMVNRDGSFLLREKERYYFLFNMQKGEMGMPFRNDPRDAFIFPDSTWISRALMPDIREYFANPARFSEESIDGLSLYVFQAEVVLIRSPESP